MEILNIVGLLLIAATNAWIALQVKAQRTETHNHIEVRSAEIDYDSLARAMEASWPTVNVTNELDIDYAKIGNAIKMALIESGVALHNAQLPVQIPVYPLVPQPPSPYWQSPTVSQTDVVDDQEYRTINDGTEVPVRSFPKRMVNGKGDTQ